MHTCRRCRPRTRQVQYCVHLHVFCTARGFQRAFRRWSRVRAATTDTRQTGELKTGLNNKAPELQEHLQVHTQVKVMLYTAEYYIEYYIDSVYMSCTSITCGLVFTDVKQARAPASSCLSDGGDGCRGDTQPGLRENCVLAPRGDVPGLKHR